MQRDNALIRNERALEVTVPLDAVLMVVGINIKIVDLELSVQEVVAKGRRLDLESN